jgi:hypothetical protein
LQKAALRDSDTDTQTLTQTPSPASASRLPRYTRKKTMY